MKSHEIFASGRTRQASKSPGSQSDAQRDARATDALELDLESASDFCLNFVAFVAYQSSLELMIDLSSFLFSYRDAINLSNLLPFGSLI